MSKKVFHFKHTFNTDFNWSENIVNLSSPYNGWHLSDNNLKEGALCLDYFEKVSIEEVIEWEIREIDGSFWDERDEEPDLGDWRER